jgi:hypothetical protein
MNLIKSTCLAVILLVNVASTVSADDYRWINFSGSGGGAVGGCFTDGDLESTRSEPATYTFYNELRIVDGDKIVLTVWGHAREAMEYRWSSSTRRWYVSSTQFNFPARSIVIHRTTGGDRITGFKVPGASQYTDYSFDWESDQSSYDGPEFAGFQMGVVNCDVVWLSMTCSSMIICGDRPGIDYGMTWQIYGRNLLVRTVGSSLPDLPRNLFR